MKDCQNCNKIIQQRPKEKPGVFKKRKFCFILCRMRALCEGNKGKLHSNQYKQKMSRRIKQLRQQQPFTEERNEKIRQANLGKKLTDEIKKKISITLTGKLTGDKHWNWQGGITPLRDRDNDSPRYKEWRKLVFRRDGFKCAKCENSKSGNIQAHHIKEYSKYPKLRYDVDNGLTVCIDCHKEIHYGKS